MNVSIYTDTIRLTIASTSTDHLRRRATDLQQQLDDWPTCWNQQRKQLSAHTLQVITDTIRQRGDQGV